MNEYIIKLNTSGVEQLYYHGVTRFYKTTVPTTTGQREYAKVFKSLKNARISVTKILKRLKHDLFLNSIEIVAK